MTDTTSNGSVNSGSSFGPAVTPGSQGPNAGQPTGMGNIENTQAYKELEKKLGSQGQELGEYRNFFEGIKPLLVKLNDAPQLVQAIIDGKVTEDLARAALDGRVSLSDAQVVAAAHEQVKEKAGDARYSQMTADQVSKLVEAEAQKLRKELADNAEWQQFQDRTQSFIANTADFQDYSQEIEKWLDTHDIDDVEVAYYAVKGKLSDTKAKEAADVAAAERMKEYASNASGGGVHPQFSPDGTPMVDKLIAGRPGSNPLW